MGYTVKVHVDADGDMVIVQNPSDVVHTSEVWHVPPFLPLHLSFY